MPKGIPKSGINKGWFTTERMSGDLNPAKRPEVRKKLSLQKIGNKNPVKRKDVRLKISNTIKGSKQSKETIEKRMKHPNIQKILFKIGNTLGECNKGRMSGGYEAKHEKQILDEIELSIESPIIRQYVIKRYIVDGYCKERNIVFEIDELHHYKYGLLRLKDIIRQQEIENKLNCIFIRIPV